MLVFCSYRTIISKTFTTKEINYLQHSIDRIVYNIKNKKIINSILFIIKTIKVKTNRESITSTKSKITNSILVIIIIIILLHNI